MNLSDTDVIGYWFEIDIRRLTDDGEWYRLGHPEETWTEDSEPPKTAKLWENHEGGGYNVDLTSSASLRKSTRITYASRHFTRINYDLEMYDSRCR